MAKPLPEIHYHTHHTPHSGSHNKGGAGIGRFLKNASILTLLSGAGLLAVAGLGEVTQYPHKNYVRSVSNIAMGLANEITLRIDQCPKSDCAKDIGHALQVFWAGSARNGIKTLGNRATDGAHALERKVTDDSSVRTWLAEASSLLASVAIEGFDGDFRTKDGTVPGLVPGAGSPHNRFVYICKPLPVPSGKPYSEKRVQAFWTDMQRQFDSQIGDRGSKLSRMLDAGPDVALHIPHQDQYFSGKNKELKMVSLSEKGQSHTFPCGTETGDLHRVDGAIPTYSAFRLREVFGFNKHCKTPDYPWEYGRLNSKTTACNTANPPAPYVRPAGP